MASPTKFPKFLFFLALCFLCFPSQIHSLSTVSISNAYNQTLVCAAISSPNQQPLINCTSFSSGLIQYPIKFQNVSYSRIVGGNGFLCALRSQSVLSANTVMECWRFTGNMTNISPKRVYRGPALSELESGNSHVCGLVSGTNELKCWQWRKGLNPESESHPRFSSIAVGDDFVCGLDANGSVSCLGKDANVVNGMINPSGKYRRIAAGSHHLCAISLDGSLQCWGNILGKIPEGEFMDLALGDYRSCSLRINGTVVCWGENGFEMPTRLKEAFFIGIVAKQDVFCGVLSSNFSLSCWGNVIPNNGNDILVFPKVMPGHCTTQCSCDPLPGYGSFCGQGLMICQPCSQRTISLPPTSSPRVARPPLGQPNSTSSSWNAKMVVLLVVGCLGSVSLVATIVFSMWMCRRSKGSSRVHDSGPIEMAENPREAANSQGSQDDVEGQPVARPVLEKRLSHMYSMGNGGTLEEIPLEVLLQVTNNFSQEHRIGMGSFGAVYHATLEDGREVAIKRAELYSSSTSLVGINRRQEDKDTAFFAELEFLSRVNHKHLVRLLGFYEDVNERILVYEFMSNGTLHDHLHKLKNSSPLASWSARFKVALDAAKGIQYLHEFARPTIIHRDIKPSNILLDHNWTAKVSDFGLSLMGPQDGETHISLLAAGTFGYVDPEYYRLHQLTTKSDVYSFGVVLLELLSGYKAIHTKEDGSHRNVVDFVVPYIMREEIHRVLDPNVPPPTPVEIEAVNYVGYLAVDCVSLGGRLRPSMSEVVGCLERALTACLAPPSLCSSSTASSR